MKLKVLKTSPTGQKLQAIIDECNACQRASSDLSNQLGGSAYRRGSFVLAGGISAISFKETPGGNHWIYRPQYDDYVPNRRTKKGKEIYNQFKNLPSITPKPLNAIFNLNEWFNHPGVTTSKDAFGLTIKDEWIDQITIPDDCVEITVTQFNQEFKKG